MKLANNKHIIFILSTLVICTHISSCSGIPITRKDGSVHHLIIGIGIVSTPKNNGEYGVLATKTEVVGIHASTQLGGKFGAGYSSSSIITIPDNSRNVVVEVSQTPFGHLLINANPFKIGQIDEK
jgi:hypothetical protein